MNIETKAENNAMKKAPRDARAASDRRIIDHESE
jgi:hypothetical protein